MAYKKKVSGFYLKRHYARVKSKWMCLKCERICATGQRSLHLKICDPRAYASLANPAVKGRKYNPIPKGKKAGRKGKGMQQQPWFVELKDEMEQEGIIKP